MRVASQDIRNPIRLAAMLAPGFADWSLIVAPTD